MDKRWIKLKDKLSIQYRGFTKFLDTVEFHLNNLEKTRCPSKNCMNSMWESLERVE